MAHTVEPLIWRKGFNLKQAPAPAALHRHLRLAAQFAALAAHNDDLRTLQHEICRVAAEGLKVTFAKLLVYQADEGAFVLQAGIGWRKGIVDIARLDADVGTAAGFAWHSGQAIISNDLAFDKRFRVPALLAEHGIIRCINVVVPNDQDAAFGVLEVESPELGLFTEYDVSFLQLLTHSLASAIGRVTSRALHDEESAQKTLDHYVALQEMQHRVCNDLQVLYGFFEGEARRMSDPAEVAGLGKVGRRVIALAELYNHLLSRQETEEVDLGAYLRVLCAKVESAADLSSRGITLKAKTERLIIPLDQAVRLAVAVNELITNAAKHAFSGRTSGRITVKLTAKAPDSGLPVVSVTDNGGGFSGLRPGGAGLIFVKHLIHLAGGVLEREEGKGTRWDIKIASNASASS